METKLVAHIDDFKLGYWSEEDQEWYELDKMDEEDIAKHLSCSIGMISFLRMNFADLVEQVKADLVDLYKK